jgi:hypothetical protein
MASFVVVAKQQGVDSSQQYMTICCLRGAAPIPSHGSSMTSSVATSACHMACSFLQAPLATGLSGSILELWPLMRPMPAIQLYIAERVVVDPVVL